MAKDLKVVALSMNIECCRPNENMAVALNMISKLDDDVDVIVLPELFSTSFISDKERLSKYAETNDGPTIDTLREVSTARNCMLSGSFAAVEDGQFFNRGFMLLPDGSEAFYNKRHLFSVSKEAEIFTQGQAYMPVLNFHGWNVSMMICYDLRFPVWSRNVRHRYDMLLVPANWPMSRGYAWTHLLIARAIENQAVVVGANRGGSDVFGNYDGLSEIFDGLGKPIGRRIEDGTAVEAIVSYSELLEARRKLPAHFDADDFTIPIS